MNIWTVEEKTDGVEVLEDEVTIATVNGCTPEFLAHLTLMPAAFKVLEALADYTDPTAVKEEKGRALLEEVHAIVNALDGI